MQAQEQLQRTRRELSAGTPDKYARSPLSDSKGQELFARLERFMKGERVYCDRELTIDRLA